MKCERIELDAELPARMGDPSLCAPVEESVLEICREHLSLAAATRASCTHARWKRGISLSTSWNVGSTSQFLAQVVVKRYAKDKAAQLALRQPLPDLVVLPERGLAAWRFPTDRELPGLVRLFDMHRTTRLLHDSGCLHPWVARWSTSSFETLRYKPEHRAVVRLDLDLRFGDKHGARSRRSIAARALCTQDAQQRLARRVALGFMSGPEPWPRFLGGQARTGLFFEEWLAGTVSSRDDFRLAFEVGGLLRELHSRKLPAAARMSRARERVVSDLFEGDRVASTLARAVAIPRSARRTWIHGDVHPDQVLIGSEDGRARLLDLDNLDAGDPHRDLACWIADHLSRAPDLSLEDAAGPLFAGYRLAVDRSALREHVAFELAALAAGALRRLEPGALERATSLLARAVELIEGVRRP